MAIGRMRGGYNAGTGPSNVKGRSLISATMQLDRETGSGNIIKSYSAGELRINDAIFTNHVIVSADDIIENWSPAIISELSIADFSAAIRSRPELIIFGTGIEQIFPPATVMTEILRQGIGFEVMDTAAACRTFNVLAGERRRIAAALMLR